MRQLYIDLDGVLADFDAHYRNVFGNELNRRGPEPPDMWDNIRSRGTPWFQELPLIPGALDFWRDIQLYSPKILSGCNPEEIPDAHYQKRRWVNRYLGYSVELYTCRSRDKCEFARPGDVLVDDWHKYRHLWEKKGGIFILHTDFLTSLGKIRQYLSLEL